eukprot:gene1036-3897_t
MNNRALTGTKLNLKMDVLPGGNFNPGEELIFAISVCRQGPKDEEGCLAAKGLTNGNPANNRDLVTHVNVVDDGKPTVYMGFEDCRPPSDNCGDICYEDFQFQLDFINNESITPCPNLNYICPTVEGYDETPQVDRGGSDIACTPAPSLAALKSQCDVDTSCLAFNYFRPDSGVMSGCRKTSATPLAPFNRFFMCFYSRKEEAPSYEEAPSSAEESTPSWSCTWSLTWSLT